MIFPSIDDLAGSKYNRYEIVIAVAKGARKIIDEKNLEKEESNILMPPPIKGSAGSPGGSTAQSEFEKEEFTDEKAVNLSVQKIFNNEYKIQYLG